MMWFYVVLSPITAACSSEFYLYKLMKQLFIAIFFINSMNIIKFKVYWKKWGFAQAQRKSKCQTVNWIYFK